MKARIILSVPVLMFLGACTGTRDDRTAAAHADPCELMRAEATTADELERDMHYLSWRTSPEPGPEDSEDSAARVTAESLLVQKENLLAMTLQSMQANAQACAARSQPFDRYRTVPEREEGL